MLRSLAKHKVLGTALFQGNSGTSILRTPLRINHEYSISLTPPRYTTFSSPFPHSPSSCLSTIFARRFATSTKNESQSEENTSGDVKQGSTTNNAKEEAENTSTKDTANEETSANQQSKDDKAQQDEGDDVETPLWRKAQQQSKERQQQQQQQQAPAKNLAGNLQVYMFHGVVLGSVLLLMHEAYKWYNNKEGAWIPSILVQYVLMEMVPMTLQNKNLIAKYGPINIYEQSIGFQQFGKDFIVITYVLYQMKSGARAGTCYIDLERSPDNVFHIKDAYIVPPLGGELEDAGEKEYSKLAYDITDVYKYGELGAMALMEKQRKDEEDMRKKQEEMERVEREKTPLRSFYGRAS